MRKKLEIFYLIFFTGFLNTPCFAQKTAIEYPDPNRFEEAILHFESLDSITFPPENAIVCVGSSSMRGWTGTITKDLAPLTVIPRGFGGSNMNDALYFSDRIILKYKPRAIVLYEGDNDIALGISPEIILEKFQEFAEKESLIYNKQFYYGAEISADVIISENLLDTIIEYYLNSKDILDFLEQAYLSNKQANNQSLEL